MVIITTEKDSGSVEVITATAQDSCIVSFTAVKSDCRRAITTAGY